MNLYYFKIKKNINKKTKGVEWFTLEIDSLHYILLQFNDVFPMYNNNKTKRANLRTTKQK
jgi:hypothetical protein